MRINIVIFYFFIGIAATASNFYFPLLAPHFINQQQSAHHSVLVQTHKDITHGDIATTLGRILKVRIGRIENGVFSYSIENLDQVQTAKLLEIETTNIFHNRKSYTVKFQNVYGKIHVFGPDLAGQAINERLKELFASAADDKKPWVHEQKEDMVTWLTVPLPGPTSVEAALHRKFFSIKNIDVLIYMTLPNSLIYPNQDQYENTSFKAPDDLKFAIIGSQIKFTLPFVPTMTINELAQLIRKELRWSPDQELFFIRAGKNLLLHPNATLLDIDKELKGLPAPYYEEGLHKTIFILYKNKNGDNDHEECHQQ